MWVIMVCFLTGMSACNDDPVEAARAVEWRADGPFRATPVAEDQRFVTWSEPAPSSWPEYVPGVEPEAHYQTRRECMQALRRALRTQPYFRDGGDHYFDAVETPSWNHPRVWGCFQEAPLVG